MESIKNKTLINLNPKRSEKEALLLSIAKWKAIVLNKGLPYLFINRRKQGINVIVPEINYLLGECGLCERYRSDGKPRCDKCPLYYADKSCFEPGSIFDKWSKNIEFYNEEGGLHYAEKMLATLKKLYLNSKE